MTTIIDTQKQFNQACRNGDILSILRSKKKWEWNCGLFDACEGGHMDIVQLMIDKGATKCYCCYKSVSEH